MMISSHLLIGGTVGLAFSQVLPGNQFLLVVIGMVGGLLPDSDMFLEHRKSFHRPLQTLFVFVISLPLLVFSSSLTTYWLTALASILLHSTGDILGQGKTKNSDIKEDDRGIYDHFRGKWLKPKRVIKVASVEDLVLTLIFGTVLISTQNTILSVISGALISAGLLQFVMDDWLTRNYLSDYDRFSEFIQMKVGYGPELEGN